jgi:hypothetical protein
MKFSCEPIQNVEEAILTRLHDHFAIFTVDLDFREGQLSHLIEVP